MFKFPLRQDIFHRAGRTYAFFANGTKKKVQKARVLFFILRMLLFPVQDWARDQAGLTRALVVHGLDLTNRSESSRSDTFTLEHGLRFFQIGGDGKEQKNHEAEGVDPFSWQRPDIFNHTQNLRVMTWVTWLERSEVPDALSLQMEAAAANEAPMSCYIVHVEPRLQFDRWTMIPAPALEPGSYFE